jgi:hypothetical protein
MENKQNGDVQIQQHILKTMLISGENINLMNWNVIKSINIYMVFKLQVEGIGFEQIR